MIVGFTGSRRGPTPAQHAALLRFAKAFPIDRFVHGGAVGCDTFAHQAVRHFHPDIPIDIYPADKPGSTIWMKAGNCIVHPARPPLERNRAIVKLVYGLLAAPQRDDEDWGSGTWATVRYAREVGCPVVLIRQDGRLVRDAGAP